MKPKFASPPASPALCEMPFVKEFLPLVYLSSRPLPTSWVGMDYARVHNHAWFVRMYDLRKNSVVLGWASSSMINLNHWHEKTNAVKPLGGGGFLLPSSLQCQDRGANRHSHSVNTWNAWASVCCPNLITFSAPTTTQNKRVRSCS